MSIYISMAVCIKISSQHSVAWNEFGTLFRTQTVSKFYLYVAEVAEHSFDRGRGSW